MRTIEAAAREYAINAMNFKNGENPDDWELVMDIDVKAFKSGVEYSQQWISVDKELPTHAQQVIMKSARYYMPVAGYYEYATFRNHIGEIVYDVTHWRPIELK